MAQEINFIRPQEVYDRNTGESKVRYRSYDGDNRFIPVLEGENGVPKTMVKVTHAELKTMRDGGKLTAGALYRITDYNCTTTQENTQSAGHQFDIVLLALSANKLAEEGWAMEHPTDVYDVTFAQDNVTKKCYLYEFAEDDVNLVFVDNLLGLNLGMTTEDFLAFDAINKTATLDMNYSEFINNVVEGVQYNYFQNSNLSAWKVWYCLDNDKSRFAWADDSVDEDSLAFITIIEPREGTISTLYRYSAGDLNNRFAWKSEGGLIPLYTASQTPSAGDTIYSNEGRELATVNSFTPAQEGTGLPNGRGVIYRLIDEWGNDVGYDFKNIQFVRPCTNGQYDEKGENTWCYTFSINSEDGIIDASMNRIAYSNKIFGDYELSNNVRFGEGSGYIDMFSKSCTILNSYIVLYGTENKVISSDSGIFFDGKKVLTEE